MEEKLLNNIWKFIAVWLVTYHGNNRLPEGEYSLYRMREVLNSKENQIFHAF